MPAIIEQLPTSDDEDQTTPPTECHDVTRADGGDAAPAPSTAAASGPLSVSDDAVAATASAAPADIDDDDGERVVDVERCGQLKTAGNQLFKEGNVSEALAMYRQALWYAPIKPVPSRPAKSSMPKPPTDAADADAPGTSSGGSTSDKHDDNHNASRSNAEDAAIAAAKAAKDGKGSDSEHDEEPVDTTDYTLTSQVYCNAGFCLMKLDVKEEASHMLSEAIRHDEHYLKAYLRRADCYYDLQKWSNAYGDYENYEKLGGVLDAQGRARKTTAKAKVDEEMQKMLGELKNIGNKILGNFGLSTDNFKFDKDPNNGGYSMRFER